MAQKQPQDPYAQKTKKLTSGVQRLRGWVGTDPAKATELVDALIELTAHRLLGHGYAEAAADAQDAMVASAKLLASYGPIGPYTPMPDAARYFTATVHLATIQAGMGLPEAAGRTMEAALEWKEQLPKEGLDGLLLPRTAVWALAAVARGALAEGDFAKANAFADAASARLVEAGLDTEDETTLLALDLERLLSDCRWAAGRAEDALLLVRRALARYEDVSLPRLVEPARLSPALLERLVDPAFGLYRDVADRLVATGDVATGLQTRRAALGLLGRVSGRRGDPGTAQLALTWIDLASDLQSADRIDEAEESARTAAHLAAGLPGPLREPTELLVMPTLASVLARQGRGEEAMAALEPVLLPVVSRDVATAADLLAMSALADAQRALGADDDAASTARTYDEAAQPFLQAVDWASLGSVEIDSILADRARGVVTRSARRLSSWPALAEDASFAGTTAGLASARVGLEELERRAAEERHAVALRAAAERAEAERLEQERQAVARGEAERRAAERAEAERTAAREAEARRVAAEAAEAERLARERSEAERLAAEEEAARLATKRLREERLEAYRREAERAEAARLEAERIEAERREAELRVADPAEAERLELERLEAELAELERQEAERLEAERLELERLEAERVAAERAEAERVAAERAEAERVEAERLEAVRVEAERSEVERLAAEEAARLETERAEAERAAVERLEAERVEAERAEAERLEAERAEAERVAAERAEVERVAAERAEVERVESEHAEVERLKWERAEAERVEAERAEVERLAAEEAARLETERAEAERAAVERLEAERVEAERAEAERLEAERAEVERLKWERAEAERVEAERLEAVRVEAERAEVERLAAEEAARLETERAEAERAEAERAEVERVEAERLEAVRVEAERLEAVRVEAERQAADEAARVEAQRPAVAETATAPTEDDYSAAQQAWSEAQNSGDRRAVRDAVLRVVELLRPLAEENPEERGPELIAALEALAKARWQTGDLWGSRGPAKEAKALAKQLGR